MSSREIRCLTPVGVVAASARLSGAFATGDVSAALSCFVPDDQVVYQGSARDDRAEGHLALRELLERLLARPEALAWQLHRPFVAITGRRAVLCSEATGTTRTRGVSSTFAYRLTGSLERCGDRWLWRVCHGAVPAGV